MPIQVLMPALSPTMTEGSLAKWHKKEGDPVKAGDILAEIETDKATMEFEAVDEGTLGRILVPEGTKGVPVNQPIAVILGEGESAGDIAKAPAAPPKAAAPAPAAQPVPKPVSAPAAANAAAPKPAPAPPPARGAATQSPARGPAFARRVFVSPLARRLAERSNIDLSRLAGSGPHGRIVKADVEAAMTRGPAAAAEITYPKAKVVAEAGNIAFTEVPHTNMRRVIAKRMTESKRNVPHYYLTVDCDIDALMKARADLADAKGLKLSVNDFVIRAAALALKQYPKANASYSDDAILRWSQVDIAVAVALEDGLITPIIKKADEKSVAAISAEMKDLGLRARAGKLKLTEFQGGTFSLSNLGMFGIREFTAVINPPQSCILAVGVGEKRAVVKHDQLAIATIMSCTLACDHRVLDGAEGSQWLQIFKKLIEEPAALLV
ncbi:MAG TPA: pyruvate dehydrogenase complex dihydrolipoamide acetyltransferase [Stellaceae bacterium]|nr:pyruvate dehydrogenase complex dihydrolipoamide acetyltransferase [Stellaceae bacterium]